VKAQEHSDAKEREKPGYLKGRESEVVELFEEVIPSFVVIITSRNVIDEEGRHQVDNIGSGVLISEENHILTAAHVVNSADDITVRTFDGEIKQAEVIFSEGSADIALIKLSTPVSGLKFARLGNSDNLAVGQYIYVIGTPYGLENSFSVGHISGFREFDRLYDGTIRAEFIQTDAAINSGNSGGPAFNSQGEVIGITSRILSVSGGFQGLGFVVVINTAKQLLALEERIWMGMEGFF
jgi:serine protease Do